MHLVSIGSARRAHLFDIQTVEGELYYWAETALPSVPTAITTDDSLVASTAGNPTPLHYCYAWITGHRTGETIQGAACSVSRSHCAVGLPSSEQIAVLPGRHVGIEAVSSPSAHGPGTCFVQRG